VLRSAGDEGMSESGSQSAGGNGVVHGPARFLGGDLLPVLGQGLPAEPLEPDDAENAVGRRLRRVRVERRLATVYLIFNDATYLTYAARRDDVGVILLDRFCAPERTYGDYWVFDELAGEIGPPPRTVAPRPDTPEHPASWRGAEGRTVGALGWYETGMQAFIHFEEGGYLTFAARASGGRAYLLGAFAAEEPADPEDYIIFDTPDGAPS
jgi:hypothetical protein